VRLAGITALELNTNGFITTITPAHDSRQSTQRSGVPALR
jgi:hypothetical protein